MKTWLLTALLLVSACSMQQVLNSMTPATGYDLISNLTFDPATGLKLDIYKPTGAKNAPVVIFYYGGRWEQEFTTPKEKYRFVGEALAAHGIVAVIPDYRLYPQVKFPAFVQDSAQAVKWVHEHIGDYGGSPAKIVLLGHSSGAYNAVMLAVNGSFLDDVGGSRAWLKGVIGLAGPYDFMPITPPDLRYIFGPPEDFEKSQPVFWVDGSNPPLLLIQGDADVEVNPSNTRQLAARVQRAGGPVESIFYPKLDHADVLEVFGAPLRSRADVLGNVVDFVNKVTGSGAVAKPKPPSAATVSTPAAPVGH